REVHVDDDLEGPALLGRPDAPGRQGDQPHHQPDHHGGDGQPSPEHPDPTPSRAHDDPILLAPAGVRSGAGRPGRAGETCHHAPEKELTIRPTGGAVKPLLATAPPGSPGPMAARPRGRGAPPGSPRPPPKDAPGGSGGPPRSPRDGP